MLTIKDAGRRKFRRLEFYRTESGRRPVIEWLDSLDEERAQSVLIGLRFFEEYPAVLLSSKLFEKVTEQLWEIKVHHGQEQFRLLAFLDGASVVVATHGFAKKSMSLKPRDLRLAEVRRRDYCLRKAKGI